MASEWSTYEMHTDGQTEWLVRLYEHVVNDGIRKYNVMSEASKGAIGVEIPELYEQAEVVRYRDILPPGNNVPTGLIDFI